MGTRPRSSAQARLKPDPEAAIEQVRSVYRDLESRPVERFCERRTECCRFKLTGLTPQLTKGEALLAAKAYRSTGRTKLPERPDGSCPMLDPMGKCLIYESRPFGCRTHFCAAAGGPYARREVLDLIRRLENVDRQLGGNGAIPIQTAIRRALD
jgi:Fe-S-cluster containining protein